MQYFPNRCHHLEHQESIYCFQKGLGLNIKDFANNIETLTEIFAKHTKLQYSIFFNYKFQESLIYIHDGGKTFL